MRIAINGAGIAGSALAFWLYRCGHEPVLVEKAPKFRTGGYMIDFWGVGYTIAEKMGILPKVLDAGYSVQELRLVNNRGRKVEDFPPKYFGALPTTDSPACPAEILLTRFIEASKIELKRSSATVFRQLSRTTQASAPVSSTDAREFDLVIGADGLHSRVRELVFGSESQFEKQLGYHVAAFEVEGYRPRDELVYVSNSLPGRQASRFSLRNDRTMFLFLFADEYLSGPEPREATDRKATLHRIFAGAGWECPQILEAMDRAEDIYFDRVSQIRMPAWSEGRVMLIGDAAACVSLMAGEGTGLAMTEAYVLAGELKRAGIDYPQAFRRHEQRLRPFVEGKQKSAQYFASAFAPKTKAGVWLRNQVTKLMGIPVVADWFLGREVRDDFDLPNYEIFVPTDRE